MSSVFMVFGWECTSQLLAVNIYPRVIFGQVLIHFYPVSRSEEKKWAKKVSSSDRSRSVKLTVATICISIAYVK